MANLKLPAIIRGADWAAHLSWTIEDDTGAPVQQDWHDYELDCQFKTEQGTDKPVIVAPTLSIIDTETLQITLDETQTEALPVGVLFFNLLATRANWTQQVIGGTIIVAPGVTVHA